jgi:hypothetical protein
MEAKDISSDLESINFDAGEVLVANFRTAIQSGDITRISNVIRELKEKVEELLGVQYKNMFNM